MNDRADLVVGHKGKLSRILSKDYLPYPELYEVPEKQKVKRIFKNNSVVIPDNFFGQLKEQNDETHLMNEKLKKRQKSPE